MKVKGFKDGNTFVLTFDGANQDCIGKLIKLFNPEILDPVEADPIIMEQNEPMSMQNDGPVLPENRLFGKGPLEGMTVVQALSELQDKAFRILSFYLSSKKFPEDMREYCAARLNDYVVFRFENYAGKTSTEVMKSVANLQEDELNEFIELFFPLITKKMWDAIKSSPERAGEINEKQKRMLVTLIILRGASYSSR